MKAGMCPVLSDHGALRDQAFTIASTRTSPQPQRHRLCPGNGVILSGLGFRHLHPSVGLPVRHYGCNVKDRAGLRGDFAVRRVGVWIRDWVPILAHPIQMELDCLLHRSLHLVPCAASRHTTRKVRRIRGESCAGLLNYDKILAHLSPACFRMLFSVPAARSSPGLPAIVTRPGFEGCLNCR